eukprot:TRINITY_DN20755_c0_g1_i1.p1 TRINITY_DN20755_c0_g1~~TRINITY_DN20755_c0_g1_i1.p1  ORF type:complete len:102 (-),score=11.02 TRINITY_DN20755_c0_g1_i1:153-458(-)
MFLERERFRMDTSWRYENQCHSSNYYNQTTSTTTTTSPAIKSSLQSPQSHFNLSLNILPSTKIARNLALARMVPFVVSVFVIIVLLCCCQHGTFYCSRGAF